MGRALLAVILLLVGAPSTQHAPPVPTDEAFALALRILPIHQFAPGTAAYRIQITPHRDNIWFCMGWHSEDAAITNRTSCQQLNGIYSPRVVYQEYRALARGTYHGFVDLYRVPNYRAHTATQTFIVVPTQ